MQRVIAATVLAATVALVPAAAAEDFTVVSRIRLGNNVEDMTFVPSGLYANQFAVLDGLDVIGMPTMDQGHGGGRHKLFDVTRLPLTRQPCLTEPSRPSAWAAS